MRYFGSKTSTLGALEALIRSRLPYGTFADPFGGVATVGSYFKSLGYTVFSGDLLRFAYCFQVARVEFSGFPRFTRLCELGFKNATAIGQHLSKLTPSATDNWFTREYGRLRKFFTLDNAARIDAIRREIRRWSKNNLISEKEEAVLLASLISSADRVANTAGTYYAFLKSWYRKAKNPFRFDFLKPATGPHGRAFHGQALQLVRAREYDILYLDPPYNERDYSAYYHLPETLATTNRYRQLHGKGGLPSSVQRSDFNTPARAPEALREIVRSARCKLLVFHYSDNGLIGRSDAYDILRQQGRVRSLIVDSNGYTTSRSCRIVKHRIYIVENV